MIWRVLKMFKNKCIIFIIFALALLSISVASAEDVSSLDITDVSTDLMNDPSTEIVTSEYGEKISLDVVSGDDDDLTSADQIISHSELIDGHGGLVNGYFPHPPRPCPSHGINVPFY